MENIQTLIAQHPLVEDLVALKAPPPGALSNLSWPQSLPCKNGWKKSSGNTLTAKSC